MPLHPKVQIEDRASIEIVKDIPISWVASSTPEISGNLYPGIWAISINPGDRGSTRIRVSGQTLYPLEYTGRIQNFVHFAAEGRQLFRIQNDLQK